MHLYGCDDRPAMRLTPMSRLADHLLSGRLEEFVLTRRAAGMSWRRISLDIYDATDRTIDVSNVSLRNWFLEDANGDKEAA